MNKFFIFILAIFSVSSVMYACESACSLEKLREQSFTVENAVANILNNNFEINDALFFSPAGNDISYKDLFIYKNSVFLSDLL